MTVGLYGVKTVIHDFHQKLEFSNGANILNDIERIKHALHRCEYVEKTDIETDKTGVDYFAYIKGGVVVNVDAKRRESGSSQYWKRGEPELAIETWSVVEKVIGWTYNIKNKADYILYSFEPCDSNEWYFVPLQLLRKAAWDNGTNWRLRYGELTQHSNGWNSRCIFVPASVVIKAITETMKRKAI